MLRQLHYLIYFVLPLYVFSCKDNTGDARSEIAVDTFVVGEEEEAHSLISDISRQASITPLDTLFFIGQVEKVLAHGRSLYVQGNHSFFCKYIVIWSSKK